MRLASRVERLEKVVTIRMPKPIPTLVYVRDPNLTDGQQKQTAISYYKAEHPGWKGDDFMLISTVSEECKQLTLRVLSGERTTRG